MKCKLEKQCSPDNSRKNMNIEGNGINGEAYNCAIRRNVRIIQRSYYLGATVHHMLNYTCRWQTQQAGVDGQTKCH